MSSLLALSLPGSDFVAEVHDGSILLMLLVTAKLKPFLVVACGRDGAYVFKITLEMDEKCRKYVKLGYSSPFFTFLILNFEGKVSSYYWRNSGFLQKLNNHV